MLKIAVCVSGGGTNLHRPLSMELNKNNHKYRDCGSDQQ